jgi:hypothetical protein
MARKGRNLSTVNKTRRPRQSIDPGQLNPISEPKMYQFPFAKMEVRPGRPGCDKHFLHTNVVLRYASGNSAEAEQHIETILTKAAAAKRRVWVSSLLFAELRPSMFVPGRFASLCEFTRYIRSLATLVTPDPNTMLRVGRLRDAKWQRPASIRQADEKPQSMSLGDAIQIASALWVKEAIGVPDLEFLMFDDWSSNGAKGAGRLAELHLQNYAEDGRADLDVMAAARLTPVQPVLRAHAIPQSVLGR